MEEFGRLPRTGGEADQTQEKIVLRLEFIMTEVPTPRKLVWGSLILGFS